MKKTWKKKWVAGILCTSLVTVLLPVHGMERNVAAAEVAQKEQEFAVVRNAGSEEKKIQNIIYMIPDGGGYPSYDIAKAVKEKGGLTYCNNKGTKQTANKMYLDDYLAGSIKTKSADNDTTDSAAAGTALAAGEKTNNGYIGVDTSGKPVASIAEMAQIEGKATGLISTSYAYDATPAAFATHHMSRGGYDTIIQQMMYTDLDVVISAGMMYEGYTKQDNVGTIRKQGYTLADSASGLKKATQTATEGTKVWGNFMQSSHHIPFDIGYGIKFDGINDEAKQTPTLAEMTDCAIEILSKDSGGFFLMVEGSKIDYGNHHGKMTESVGEWIAFDEAFKVALDYAKEHQDTAIVVAPDHNTGLKSTPDKMSSVVSMVQKGNNPGSDLLEFSASNSEYPHTGADVGVYIYVPEGCQRPAGLSEQNITKASERSKFVIDNTELAPYMASLISDKTLTDITNELYIDVTEKGTYSDNKFTFKDKNAFVTINTDQAENNGKKIDLNGQIAVYCNKHCYVPKSLTDNLGIKVDIPGKHDLKGTGTKTDPYLITNADNFLTFTNQILAGNAYKGKYIKQTADIDMSQITDYVGIYGNDKILFGGTYDGQGHTITVDIRTENTAGFSIFPYTTGTIRNLGTTGSMKNTADTGGCSGIVRSIRDGGSIVNCWSTVDLTARYEVAAIAFSVRGTGAVCNCYYKGKMTGEYNYGIASRSSSDSGKMTESNCYYQLESGSSSINEKGNNEALGTAVTDFSAKTLNGYQDSAVSKLSSLSTKEQLCQFVDIKGYEFAFAGSVAKLEKMSYTYTLKDGSEETVYQNNFTPDKYGYDMIIQENMNANLPIKISGTPLDGSSILEIEEGQTILDTKGCGNGAVTITTGVKTDYYETTGKVRYSVLFSGPAPGEVTASPEITQTPIVTETPTVTGTPIVTKTPMVTRTPIVTNTPIVTKTPTVTETPIVSKTPMVTETPIVTKTPIVTQTPTVTETPMVSKMPTVTEAPEVTATPEVTTIPIETEKPVVTKKPAQSPKTDIQQFVIKNVKNSYIYTGKKITVKNVRVVKGNRTLRLHKDYTLTYLNNTNVGTAKLVVKGIGNYKGRIVKNFKIVARSITKLKFSKLRTYRYTGKLIQPRIIVKYGTKRLKKGTDYTVTYRKNRNRGYGLMIIKGKGNFKGIKTFRFRIR